MYPELYRKGNYVKGSNEVCPDPYQVGRIKEISVKKEFKADPEPNDVKLKIHKFYR